MLKDIFGSFVKITQRVDRDLYYGDLLAQIAVKMGAQKKNAHREASIIQDTAHVASGSPTKQRRCNLSTFLPYLPLIRQIQTRLEWDSCRSLIEGRK